MFYEARRSEPLEPVSKPGFSDAMKRGEEFPCTEYVIGAGKARCFDEGWGCLALYPETQKAISGMKPKVARARSKIINLINLINLINQTRFSSIQSEIVDLGIA